MQRNPGAQAVMVSRAPKATAATALLAMLVSVFWTATPARARVGHGNGHTPQPVTTQRGGGAGGPVTKTVSSCSLYANSSGFGLYCVHGAKGAGSSETVKQYLKGDPVPTCWDEKIPDAELGDRYGLTPVPGTGYFLHTCVAGIHPTDLVATLRPVLNQQILEIPDGAPDCGSQPYRPEQAGTCLMRLTARQRGLLEASAPAGGQIPALTILTRPSTRVRTNQATAFVDKALAAGGSPKITPRYRVGAVSMWAEMGGFAILPYGPGGESHACDGTQDVAPNDTPASKPRACWWTYRASSASQPGQVYPFRAQTGWTVYYQQRGGRPVALASFVKYDDLQLPVFDIQTVVVR